MGALTEEEAKAIEVVAHYIHDEEQAYCMLYGEGVFDTIPIEADYTVGDMKLWLKVHKDKDPAEYDIVGPKGRWKMGAGSEVLQDDQVIAEFMGERFEHKWLMQLSLFPKKKNEETGSMESTFETVDEWVPPPPEDAFTDDEEDEPPAPVKKQAAVVIEEVPAATEA